jgi:glycosidase
LDYIKELGATAVWPTPLCEDNDERGSYHTYGQSDVYKIDSRFGTNDDYLHLSAELHKRGMKNIMDYVTNHWGYKHWMMNDLPTYDWIHQFPGYAQTNYRMATQMDTNASKIDKDKCVDGWFVKSMPDLNQSNPLVLNYLTQNAIWWIEYADLDGFRVDTYSYNDKEAIANGQNLSLMNIQISILLEKFGIITKLKLLIGKKIVKLLLYKVTIPTCQVLWILPFKR